MTVVDPRGPCLKKGVEIWYLEGKRFKVGIIKKILPAQDRVQLEVPGGFITLTSKDKLLMAKPKE